MAEIRSGQGVRVGMIQLSSQNLVPHRIQPLFPQLLFQDLPIRTLSKENRVVAGLFTTNTFHFAKTAAT
jgi:hypothetical protein